MVSYRSTYSGDTKPKKLIKAAESIKSIEPNPNRGFKRHKWLSGQYSGRTSDNRTIDVSLMNVDQLSPVTITIDDHCYEERIDPETGIRTITFE